VSPSYFYNKIIFTLSSIIVVKGLISVDAGLHYYVDVDVNRFMYYG